MELLVSLFVGAIFIFGISIIGIAQSYFNAWVFHKAWVLLAVPYGWAMPFTVQQTMVIFFFVGFIFTKYKTTEKKEVGELLLNSLIHPLGFWFLAWVLALFIH